MSTTMINASPALEEIVEEETDNTTKTTTGAALQKPVPIKHERSHEDSSSRYKSVRPKRAARMDTISRLQQPQPTTSSSTTDGGGAAAIFHNSNNSNHSHNRKNKNNNHNNGTPGRKRQRKLLPLSIFLHPLGESSQDEKQKQPQQKGGWCGPHHSEQLDTAQFSKLLGVLLLTTVLGFLAALDAKHQCLKHETVSMMEDNVDFNDDEQEEAYEAALEEARRIEADGCLKMFRGVCLPVLGATLAFGSLGLWILRQKQTTPKEALRWTGRLLVALIFILVAQTFLVTHIMLRPRMQDNSENPFHSLGAVDVSGQIGDNANLYYLVWLGEGLTITLVYQAVSALVRTSRAADQAAMAQGLLPSTSWWIIDEEYDRENHESRHTWYKSIYKLRVRTGIWTAALITCLVLTASAQYVWRQFMWPYVLLGDDNDDGDGGGSGSNSNNNNDDAGESGIGLLWGDTMDFSFCQTMEYNSDGVVSVTLCRRTVMAWFSGVLSFLLSAFSIGMHLVARARAHGLVANEHRQQMFYLQRINIFRKLLNRHRVPLGTELILSVVLSLLLGLNAVLSTGVQGPATTVGNLYYSSWGSFLLVVRIAVGCLEEWYEVEPKDDLSVALGKIQGKASRKASTASQTRGKETQQSETFEGVGVDGSQQSFETETSDRSGSSSVMMDPFEKDRVRRLRYYFFLCIFSTCCGSAAYDAAVNQQSDLTMVHRYMILAPCVVALQSLILFCLCLSRKCYLIASHICVGGLLSVLSFGLWLANLVLTMHSDHSWAVNGVGDIRMANLYYFSWASILTAGLQMMSYINSLFGVKKTENMALVWVAICKVCFVTLGASLHIWHNIADKCDIAELTTGAVNFCSRTVLAIVVSTVGTFVGGLVAFLRIVLAMCPSCDCQRSQAHAEMFLSIFFVLLFGATVALITGIGGPGQSVGDLFYSSWLSFAVSIYIFANCYYQIKMEDTDQEQKTADNGLENQKDISGVSKGVVA